MSADAIGFSALAGYVVGVPVSFGLLLAKGAGGAAVFLSFIWPVTALGFLGYWIGS